MKKYIWFSIKLWIFFIGFWIALILMPYFENNSNNVHETVLHINYESEQNLQAEIDSEQQTEPESEIIDEQVIVPRENKPPPLQPLLSDGKLMYDRDKGLFIIPKSAEVTMYNNHIFDRYYFAESIEEAPFESIYHEYGYTPLPDDYINGYAASENAIIIHCKEPLFAEEYEDSENLYIQLYNPRSKYRTIVLIDPGHGGADPGAVVNRVLEKDLNLDIALRLKELSEEDPDILLLLTRSDDSFVSLDARYETANAIADYFISIHNNVDEYSRNTRGTITFYNEQEGEIGESSKALAEMVQSALVAELGTRDRGYEHALYRVLRFSNIPSVLVEVSFMTNAAELANLLESEYRQKAAEALWETIKNLS